MVRITCPQCGWQYDVPKFISATAREDLLTGQDRRVTRAYWCAVLSDHQGDFSEPSSSERR